MRLRVAWVLRRELAGDVEALLIGGERPRQIARLQFHVAEPLQAHRHVALRPRVTWVLRRELAGDVEALLVGGEGPSQIARLLASHRRASPGSPPRRAAPERCLGPAPRACG